MYTECLILKVLGGHTHWRVYLQLGAALLPVGGLRAVLLQVLLLLRICQAAGDLQRGGGGGQGRPRTAAQHHVGEAFVLVGAGPVAACPAQDTHTGSEPVSQSVTQHSWCAPPNDGAWGAARTCLL